MPKFNSNQILTKALDCGDRMIGHSARKYENAANVLRDADGMGIKGVSIGAIRGSRKLSEEAARASLHTRIKTGLGASIGLGSGFLGLHKYHQHKDNKIMERIDSSYNKK